MLILSMDDRRLLALATELTAGLGEADRYARLLAAVQAVFPCDAAALLRLEEGQLRLVASIGLVPELTDRRLRPQEHPRLAAILDAAARPPGQRLVHFPADSDLPDPWDGHMLGDPHACAQVHACLGCPLLLGGRCIGLLSVDALDPRAFDDLDRDLLGLFAALAAAALHSAGLIDALERANRQQHEQLQHFSRAPQGEGRRLLGEAPAMQRLREEIALVAGSDLSVLVGGETGTGKELVAEAVHAASRRGEAPLVRLNCAAMPEQLVASQLFGHVRGAFTGAEQDRPGIFEIADGGTVFLDEVGELPMGVQATLLRVLQAGEVQRVGSDRTQHVDVRVIAATNRDLEAEQTAGRFRPDLYYRLAVFPLVVPPLRARREDIALLAGAFLEREGHRLGRGDLRLDGAAREALLSYDWPGNVRELEHVIMRAAVRAVGEGPAIIALGDLGLGAVAELPATGARSAAEARPAKLTLRERQDAFTRQVLLDSLRSHQGNWSACARELGSSPSNIQRLAARLGLR